MTHSECDHVVLTLINYIIKSHKDGDTDEICKLGNKFQQLDHAW